jgi:antitoxin component of RelBE/YafQ-DinJ toxin-antitoxin module
MKWWIVILDMSIEDQGRLFALLQRVQHQTSHACGKVDLEDLLTFFFDAGFVYPKKYATLHMYKERFRETYKKLYLSNPAIARHFIQLDDGAIQAHLSMIRFYENTWMLHHHAAIGQNGAGLRVLNQVRDYINDYRSLYSSHMDYLMCYFRPNNRFPNRVFGGFAKALSNPKHCSIDSFAYLNFHFESHHSGGEGDSGWRLDVARAEDLAELSNFYDHMSGGLMIKALDLGPDMKESNTLNQEYEKLGFKREKYIFALKKEGQLKALALAVVSDTGLNLSNLTNCVHVFIIDEEDLPVEVLYHHLATLSPHYMEDEIPVLLYPLSYVEDQSIPYEKVYNLWAFDCKHASRYYEYMGRIISGRRGIETGERVIQEVVRP